MNAPLCPYHRLINLDPTATFRVTEKCSSPSAMLQKSWFVLPPGMEFYYKQRHQDYQVLPAFLPGCNMEGGRPMELVYPDEHARLYVPVELTGERGNAIFTAAHRSPGAKIFWHLDDQFIATTIQFHQVGVQPAPGKHTITIVDEQGERITRNFEVLAKEKH
jgi:penicillin-binding protein 1C